MTAGPCVSMAKIRSIRERSAQPRSSAVRGDASLVLLRQFLVMVDGDHGVGSGGFGLGAGGVAARSTSWSHCLGRWWV
jgi:hypothetical protein